MTQPSAPDWSTRLALSVAGEVRRHRQAQGLSAQQLADRCTEVGMPIQRSVLANLESGRRTTITISEVLVLAAALRVPPGLLVFPVGQQESVEMLPNKTESPLAAVDWFAAVGKGVARRGYTASNVLFLYRRHQLLSERLRRQLQMREEVRAEFALADGSYQELSEQLAYAQTMLREQQARVLHLREEWGDVALGDSEGVSTELLEEERRASEMLANVRDLERRRANLTYLRHRLAELDSSIHDLSMDLEKVRLDISDGGWVMPRLRDDLYGVVASAPSAASEDLPPELSLEDSEEE